VDVDVETFVEAGFSPVPESAGSARRHVVDTLGTWRVDSDVAELLVSELATNAILHAATRFRVTLRRLGRSVRVEVVDTGAGVARPNRYSNTAGTGRGLAMVEKMSLAWGADESPDGKCVWFEVPAPELEGHPTTAPPRPTRWTGIGGLSRRPDGRAGDYGPSARLPTAVAA